MEKYQAILIHPNISGGRCSGQLSVKTNGILFESEEISYPLNFENIRITGGGAGNRLVFFQDKTQNDISIYTPEKSILKSPAITSYPAFAREVSHAKKTLNKPLITLLVGLALITALIAGIYFSKDKMVEALASQVPVEWEQAAGEKLFSTISVQYNFIKNDSLKKEFLKVAGPLVKQAEKEGYKIDLYFVKDRTINAFALPGGKVIVQTGLIENAKNWEEVMGVLGHEIAHVTLRHHVRGIINNIGIFVLVSATLGDISSLAGVFTNVGGELASLSNSRTFENEADEKGWNYLVNAGMHPSGLISFFETLKKESESPLDSTINKTVDLSFLSTHPNTQDRIDNLKKKEKELGQKIAPIQGDFYAFKASILKLK